MSSSAVQHDVPRRWRAPVTRVVNNLDPRCLKIPDIVDLSGIYDPRVTFGVATGRLQYTARTPFPPGSRGFLYYHRETVKAACAGEIRFRVVDVGSPSASAADLFASGRDLLDYTGYRPWRIHLTQLYTAQRYDPIRRLLLSQGLISAAQDREAENQFSGVSLAQRPGRSTIIDRISDTFVIQLPAVTLNLAFIHDEGFVPSTPTMFEVSWRERHEPDTANASAAPWRVYKGHAVVRFELERVQRTENYFKVKMGEVVLVLRILELLDPLDPDGAPFCLPEGGDFVQAQVPGRYWRMPLDRARKLGIITPSSFKILEDLYLHSGGVSLGTSLECKPVYMSLVDGSHGKENEDKRVEVVPFIGANDLENGLRLVDMWYAEPPESAEEQVGKTWIELWEIA
ncbi:hypothetical protein DFP72DRAFT_1063796 [Ephemerocybe angulata]|uniref:Uncharacterized protein n=1 Tax=Ephemerocybe angulata TaxID=980116 RepID=A0A8H6MCV8_9AGAR|nr:hypothetical protein DFP72DRAFT_1063796 [Tulosesus angulatus]